MQALEFPHGRIYQIICQENQMAVTLNMKDPASFKGSQFTSSPPNVNDPFQLFMLEKCDLAEDSFQIVSCVSGMVFDEEGEQIHARPGKQNNDQLYLLKRVGGQNNFFWIQTDIAAKKAVQMEGILRVRPFDPNHPGQIFVVVPVPPNCPILAETCVITNAVTGKSIDIPGASFEPGTRLIQYTKHRRFNQRWSWVRGSQGFMLQSLLSKLCIDVEGESKEPGAKVCQWTKTGGANQQWQLEPAGNGVFRIRPIHAPGLYLSVKGDGVDDGDKLVLNPSTVATSVWNIQGFTPR